MKNVFLFKNIPIKDIYIANYITTTLNTTGGNMGNSKWKNGKLALGKTVWGFGRAQEGLRRGPKGRRRGRGGALRFLGTSKSDFADFDGFVYRFL